ncbi:MAG: ornithine cyclodeaminase family protein, partial [Desulfobacterales bacterium]|nr:ornithine cyclodeaminase family protein [Desulfobacterales bacterium]
MKYISEDMVRDLLPPDRAIEVVEKAFADVSNGLIRTGVRGTLNVDPSGDDCIFLPAVHGSEAFYSLKCAASFPSCAVKGLPTVQSQILIFSKETGTLAAIIEANWLTALKTGAASAVAAHHLAWADTGVLAVIGAGEQAKTQMQSLCRVRDIQEIRLADLDEDRCRDLRDWARDHVNPLPRISITTSSDDAVDGADIVVTCTTSGRPVFDGRRLKQGALVNAIGGFTPEMQEIDVHTVRSAGLIVADSKAAALEFAGDLVVPIRQGQFSEDPDIPELGDIVSGKANGRSGPDQIILYESVGFPPLDLAVG